MSTIAASTPPVSADAPEASPPWRSRRFLAAAAAAWLVPLLAHLIRADWLLPPLFIAAVLGLQRGLPGVLDRITVGLGQLFGALCVAGLGYSIWPWHLHPVAMAGTAFTALLVLATLGGRRWTVRRPAGDRGWREAAVAATAAVVALLTLVPFAVRDLGARLGLLVIGEDFARHLLLFDVIGKVGGYAFIHRDRSAPFIPEALADGMPVYPQGVHFGYAVLDRFIRSASGNTTAVTQLDVMIWLYVGTFAFAALAVLWSACRVAGPGARPGRLLPVLGLVAAWWYFGDPIAVFLRGYPNEIVGLALAALLTAVVIRPLTSAADQLVTVVLLLVGISFSYHLFLPYAGLLAVLWAWRTGWWRRRAGLIAAACAAPAVLLTPLLNAHAASTTQLNAAGTALVTDKPALAVLLMVAIGGLLAWGGQRSPARRTAALALEINLAFLVLLGGFQLITIGHTVYYFDKILHLTLVVGLVLLGTLVRLVPTTRPGRLPARVPAWVAIGTAAAVTAVPLVALRGPWHDTVPSYGVRFATGADKGSPGGGRDALYIAARYPDAGGAVDVSLMSTPYRNWYATLFASAVQRNYRYGHTWYDFLNPAARPKTLADLEAAVVSSPVPVRFWVYDPQASMLVIDPDAPNREWAREGANPAAFGDPNAMNNLRAAEHLAAKYPDRVQVVRATPPDR